MSELRHFLGRLVGTRPTWPHDMSEDEQAVMGRHFEYLARLVEEGTVLVAGPVFAERPYGLVLIAAADEAAARAVLQADPSVTAGLHTVAMTEMKLSLWAGASPPAP